MPRDEDPNAEADALDNLAAAVTELLERLRDAGDPSERHTLRTEFNARIDGIREDLRRHHGLTEDRAGAVIGRSLARVIEVVRATPSRA